MRWCYLLIIYVLYGCISSKPAENTSINPRYCNTETIVGDYVWTADHLMGHALYIKENGKFEVKFWNDIGPYILFEGAYNALSDTIYLSTNKATKYNYDFTQILDTNITVRQVWDTLIIHRDSGCINLYRKLPKHHIFDSTGLHIDSMALKYHLYDRRK
jgi:hypothetical protein